MAFPIKVQNSGHVRDFFDQVVPRLQIYLTDILA